MDPLVKSRISSFVWNFDYDFGFLGGYAVCIFFFSSIFFSPFSISFFSSSFSPPLSSFTVNPAIGNGSITGIATLFYLSACLFGGLVVWLVVLSVLTMPVAFSREYLKIRFLFYYFLLYFILFVFVFVFYFILFYLILKFSY